MTQQEHEVALVGTGIAPLIAAQVLMRRGWRVVVLNPERDFFIENSELPFDPAIAVAPRSELGIAELALQRADRCREVLGPEFPGALETWPRVVRENEYLDPSAPFLRTRQWSWIELSDEDESFLEFSEKAGTGHGPEGLHRTAARHQMIVRLVLSHVIPVLRSAQSPSAIASARRR